MAETAEEHSQQLVALTSRLLVSWQQCFFVRPDISFVVTRVLSAGCSQPCSDFGIRA